MESQILLKINGFIKNRLIELCGILFALVGIFLFGIQTYFLSKLVVYLIRIFIFSIDNTLLEQEIFLIFLLGLNIIDWISILVVIVFQTMLFSIGIQYIKN